MEVKMLKRLILISTILFLNFSFLYSAEISQWRGPNRNGIYLEKNLLKKWPENGPKLLWSVEDLGSGYSSAAVTNDRVYITEMVDETGYLRAYTINGKFLWKKSYGKDWDGQYPGTRTTPAVYEGRLYLMSGVGKVFCFEAAKGEILWAVDLQKIFGARNIRWGMTESLLIDGDKVICTPGGSKVTMAALDRFTGKTIWTCKANGEKSAYCSPLLINYGKLRMLVTMIEKSIIGVNVDTGEFLWSFRHVTDYDIHANTPIYKDGYIYCTSGYGTGGVKLKLSADGKSVQEVWRNKTLDSQIGGAVLVDGYIYGSGHSKNGWQCLNWNTGEVKYRSRELGGKGNIIYAEAMLYCYSERGYVAIVKPDPSGFDVVSSFKILNGSNPHWAHLVISAGRLYVHRGNALMVYSISQ
jgi:outer membrane protein assembly factor BamB